MNMIEKVARAMCGPSFDADSFLTTPDGSTPEEHRDYWLNMARTAIEQLREPTDVMVTRGIVSYAVHGSAAKGWQAMIDSALEEGGDRNEDDHSRLRKMTTEQLAQIREEAALFDDGFKLY